MHHASARQAVDQWDDWFPARADLHQVAAFDGTEVLAQDRHLDQRVVHRTLMLPVIRLITDCAPLERPQLSLKRKDALEVVFQAPDDPPHAITRALLILVKWKSAPLPDSSNMNPTL